MTKIKAAITAVNGWVPDYVLTNKELESLVDTNDEWIMSRTGIKERRILKGKNTGSSDIAVKALEGLFEKRGVAPEEIDAIICATTTPDMVFPATANIIADKMGMKNAFGYDVSAACSGFLFSMITGAKFVESGQYKKVLVVGVDKMSSIIDYSDRATCVIFGDGGGAVLLEPNVDGYGIIDSVMKSDGSGRHYLHQKAGGSLLPATVETINARQHYVFQEGQTVFKFAVVNMAEVSAEVMKRNNLTGDDIDWLVPHQANKRIIDATAKRMGIGAEKVMMNIEKYGNTTNGTLPLCLWDYESKLKKGDSLMDPA